MLFKKPPFLFLKNILLPLIQWQENRLGPNREWQAYCSQELDSMKLVCYPIKKINGKFFTTTEDEKEIQGQHLKPV